MTLPPPKSADATADEGQSPNAQSKGASVNYTDDKQADTQKATINGRVSYLLFGIHNCTFFAGETSYNVLDPKTHEPLLDPNGNPGVQTAPDTSSFHVRGFGFAPFVSSNGTWNNPFTTTTVTTTLLTKTASAGTTVSTTSDGITTKSVVINENGTITTTTQKTSTDTLRFGTDFQAEVYSPGPAFDNFFYASPFYQTDYRDTAQIGGVDLIYEPLVAPPPGAPILGINEGYIDKTFSYLTQFSAEAELTDVSNPGYTALAKGATRLIGEAVRPNLTLFPGGPAQYPAQYDDDWFNK